MTGVDLTRIDDIFGPIVLFIMVEFSIDMPRWPTKHNFVCICNRLKILGWQ